MSKKKKSQKLRENMPPVLGVVEDEPDVRDFQYEEVMGAVKPDWKTGYDNELEYGPLREDRQGYSLGCVSFGSTNDMEMSVKKILNKDVNFSQRFIYSQIYLSGGGASARDAYKLLNQQGVCEDEYMHTAVGPNLTEAQMRDRTGLEEAKKNAAQWKIGAYRSIPPTNVEALAQAIYENGGCGGGYRSIGVNMGHFVFFPGYGYWKGYPGFKYHDSYAPHDKWIVFNNNKFYLDNPTGHQVELFSMWTAEPDKSWAKYNEETQNMSLIRKRGTKEVFLKLGNERIWVKSEEDFNLLKDNQPISGISWDNIIDVDVFDSEYNGRIVGKFDLADWLKNVLGKIN